MASGGGTPNSRSDDTPINPPGVIEVSPDTPDNGNIPLLRPPGHLAAAPPFPDSSKRRVFTNPGSAVCFNVGVLCMGVFHEGPERGHVRLLQGFEYLAELTLSGQPCHV